MEQFTSLEDARRALAALLIGSAASLPDHTRAALVTAMAQASAVDTLMQSLEALYAVKADLCDDAKRFVASLAQFVTPLGWYRIQDDNRGVAIQLAMQRDLGETAPAGSDWPEPAADPDPRVEFVPPTEPADAAAILPAEEVAPAAAEPGDPAVEDVA